MKTCLKHSFTSLSLGILTTLASVQAFASHADSIDVTQPYAREVPPGAPASASFMTLSNHSDQLIKLVEASSDAAEVVELHTHSHDNGMMRMRRVDLIEIPAHGQTELKPGGLHIMLINPHKQITLGQTISVKLNFEDGSSKQVSMPVKSVKKPMGSMNHEMHREMNHHSMH